MGIYGLRYVRRTQTCVIDVLSCAEHANDAAVAFFGMCSLPRLVQMCPSDVWAQASGPAGPDCSVNDVSSIQTVGDVQFRGHGFLRRMVRHMVGAMIAVGQHRTDPEHIKRLLRGGMPEDLREGGARGWDAAEACGLVKVDVEYPDEIKHLFDQPPPSVQVDNSCE